MKMRCLFFPMPVIISLAISSASGTDNIAVTDLTGQGVDQSSATIISDRLRTELFSIGTFKVIERQAMQEILKEQGYQQSGCVSDQCMVEMGQLLGVSKMVSGTVGKIGQLYTINIRMINVGTSEIVYSTSVDCKCAIEDLLTKSVPEIARKISQSTTGQPAKPPLTTPMPISAPKPSTGSLTVITSPPDARISLNGSDAGLTPYSNDTIETGLYQISLELEGYAAVKTNIAVGTGQAAKKEIKLEHTTAWKDSVKSAGAEKKAHNKAGQAKKKSVAPKVVFSLAAAGCAIGGVAFDSMIKGKIDDNAKLKAEYISYNDPSRSGEYQQKLNDNMNAAKSLQMARNISYILSGACAVGFSVSFAF